jgi:hypothetical protein
MRIAQLAPLAEAVPPKLYGGTERVVSWLSDELQPERLSVPVLRVLGDEDHQKRHDCRAGIDYKLPGV